MRKSQRFALAGIAVAFCIALGCSSRLDSGLSPVPELSSGGHATVDPLPDAGPDDAAGTDASGCELFLADAAVPDAAPYDPDAAWSPSPCQPHGGYQITVETTGDCMNEFHPGHDQSQLILPDPAVDPYPVLYPCTPPQPVFTADVCTAYYPPGTVCTTQFGKITLSSCGYFNCSKNADFCVYYINGRAEESDGLCHVEQTIRFTR